MWLNKWISFVGLFLGNNISGERKEDGCEEEGDKNPISRM